MSATDPSFASGAQAFDHGVAASQAAPAASSRKTKTRRRSLLNLRGSAIIIDGILLVIPILAVDYALSKLFPHRGFFWSQGTTRTTGGDNATSVTAGGGLGLPGTLMAIALMLTYFFVMEATRGQTIGKRNYGLRVQSASGEPASLNAISGRTVLRLIDQLPAFYLVGVLVALLTGRRRRRIGDWVAGTVVVREDEAYLPPPPAAAAQPQASSLPPPTQPPVPLPPPLGGPPAAPAIVHAFAPPPGTATGMPPMVGAMPPMAGTTPATPPAASAMPAARVTQPPGARTQARGRDWRLVGYPLSWIAAVLIATFVLGLGQAEGAAERAVVLVREYVQAREQGNAALACSLLTPAQQRELAASQGAGYESATATDCPRYILRTDPGSHLLNPQLSGFVAAAPTIAYASPSMVVLRSPSYPALQLVAVAEEGKLRLDVRGFQRAEFVAGCARGGLLTADQCGCTFDRLRAEGHVAENPARLTAAWRREAQAAADECRGYLGSSSE
jgi:uncharacterized RDD family membrane protein YckC